MKRGTDSMIVMFIIALVGFWLITNFYVNLPYVLRAIIGLGCAAWLAFQSWGEFRTSGGRLDFTSAQSGRKVQYWRGQRIEIDEPQRKPSLKLNVSATNYAALVYLAIGVLCVIVIGLRLAGA